MPVYKSKSKYNFKDHIVPRDGATKADFEKKHTVPSQHKDIKELMRRIEQGRPTPDV